jgi:hypothetical protein
MEIETRLCVFVDFGSHIVRGLRAALTRSQHSGGAEGGCLEKTAALHDLQDITPASLLEARM